MIQAHNSGTVIGGLTADPEFAGNDKILKLRLAVDYAGNDATDKENRTGYFNVVMYERDEQHVQFVFNQVREGKMKKGSQIVVNYSLSQGRWKSNEGENRQSVDLIANAITYAGRGNSTKSEGEGEATSSDSSASNTGSVPAKF